ncbi:MAG: hypothetical protein QOE58_365, partial [Actinomycetota bacterium]|nr:hypothetical protein [Actinomycetota bacterium]
MDARPSPPILAASSSKVPDGTASFWVTKVLTTAMGEILSDYLVHRLGNVPAVALGTVALVAAMIVQFLAPTYVPWIYWTAVAMVAVFGTMAADVLHVQFGVPYLVSTIFFALAIAVIFAVWHATEKTLSIHSIYTRRRELFYWATVMATFALGTAAGDMTAKTMNLGYLASGLGFTVLIVIPALAYWRFSLNAVVAFWSAYVLTRPVGASFADWVGKPQNLSGLGIGDPPVIAGLTLLIIGLVISMTVHRRRPAP